MCKKCRIEKESAIITSHVLNKIHLRCARSTRAGNVSRVYKTHIEITITVQEIVKIMFLTVEKTPSCHLPAMLSLNYTVQGSASLLLVRRGSPRRSARAADPSVDTPRVAVDAIDFARGVGSFLSQLIAISGAKVVQLYLSAALPDYKVCCAPSVQ